MTELQPVPKKRGTATRKQTVLPPTSDALSQQTLVHEVLPFCQVSSALQLQTLLRYLFTPSQQEVTCSLPIVDEASGETP